MNIADKILKRQTLVLKRPDIDEEVWDLLSRKYFREEGQVYFASSGTSTTDIKIFEISHEAMLGHAKALGQHFDFSSQNRWLVCLPTYFMGGLSVIYRCLANNSEYYECSPKDIFEIHRTIREKKITHVSLIPYQLQLWLDNNLDFPESLEMVFVGGEAMSFKLFTQAKKTAPHLIYPTYGLSELCSQVATSKIDVYGKYKILPWVQIKETFPAVYDSPYHYTSIIKYSKGQITQTTTAYSHIQTQDEIEVDEGHLTFLRRSDRLFKYKGKYLDLDEIEYKLSKKLPDGTFFVDSVQKKITLFTTQEIQSTELDQIIEKVIKIDEIKKTPAGKIIKSSQFYL